MTDDLDVLEQELQALLLAKAHRIADRRALRGDYHVRRINGAAWLKRERDIENTLAELHVKITALEVRIGAARAGAPRDKGPSTQAR